MKKTHITTSSLSDFSLRHMHIAESFRQALDHVSHFKKKKYSERYSCNFRLSPSLMGADRTGTATETQGGRAPMNLNSVVPFHYFQTRGKLIGSAKLLRSAFRPAYSHKYECLLEDFVVMYLIVGFTKAEAEVQIKSQCSNEMLPFCKHRC